MTRIAMNAAPDSAVITMEGGASVPPLATPASGPLRRRVFRAAAWVALGAPVRYVLKLGSSLVVTRLLFPEAFGLAATIGLVLAAVEMCSDFGISQAVIQHRQGHTFPFLNTAWSFMLVRGIWLAVIVAALAWPCAQFFGEPLLTATILVASLSLVLRGLANPRIMCWSRDLALGRAVVLVSFSDAVRVAATIAFALALRSIWALVIGGLIGEAARVIGSYVLDPVRPHWVWDRVALRQLVRFGRFVFLSSVLGFLAMRLDAVFVAKFLGMERAGVYYIAVTIASLFSGLFTPFSRAILFPAMSRCQGDVARLRKHTTNVAYLIALVVLPACIVLIANADTLLMLLYDPRYHDAARALRWLCVGAFCELAGDALNASLMASGRPYYATVATAARLGGFVALVPILGRTLGLPGYAAAVAASAALFLLVTLVGCVRHGHLAVGRLGGVLPLPLAFGVLVAGCLLLAPSATSPAAGRLLVPVLSAGGLVALWTWRRRALLQLVRP